MMESMGRSVLDTPWVHETSATPARVLWRWDSVMASSALKSALRSTACMQAVDLKTKLLLRSAAARWLSAGPVHEAAFDQQEHEIERVAERAGREDRRIHARHVKQLLRFEHTLAEPVGRADEHFRHDDDDERQRYTVAQADEGLRQRLQQHHVEQHTGPRSAHH